MFESVYKTSVYVTNHIQVVLSYASFSFITILQNKIWKNFAILF